MAIRFFWAFVLVFLLLCPVLGTAQAQVTDDQVWQQFLAWLATAQPSDNPGSLLRECHRTLTAHGTPEPNSDHHIRVITTLMKTRQDGWQVIFNNIYASKTSGFSTRPNALLVSAVTGTRPAGPSTPAWVRVATPSSWR